MSYFLIQCIFFCDMRSVPFYIKSSELPLEGKKWYQSDDAWWLYWTFGKEVLNW